MDEPCLQSSVRMSLAWHAFGLECRFYATFKPLSGQAGTLRMRLPGLTGCLCREYMNAVRCGQITKKQRVWSR